MMRDEMGLPIRPGTTPEMDNRRPSRMADDITLEEAIMRLTLRRQNLDHIYEGDSATDAVLRSVREEELDAVLDMLRRVGKPATRRLT